MRYAIVILIGLVLTVSFACQTPPKSEGGKVDLAAAVQTTLADMRRDDPSFGTFLDNSYGYVVFPSVGKGGFIVGGAFGRGEVYEQRRMIGFADITQATVGLQAGGQAFSEVIVFENKAALDNFVSNRLEPAAQASAVALKSGAAANAKYTDGVAIFAHTKGGLMGEAAVGGQRFRYTPLR
jgi:lipid-binding SYLF domain-containing protein